MITNFELTDQGTAKFNAWFSATARSNIDLTAVTLEALRSFEDGVAEGTSPHYELRGQVLVGVAGQRVGVQGDRDLMLHGHSFGGFSLCALISAASMVSPLPSG